MEYNKHFSLRTDETLLKKLQYIAQYDGRSINSQINFYIRAKVEAFEKEHGKIEVSK